MIVKKYIADTVADAQAIIQQELGPQAVVLTLRYVKPRGWRALFAPNQVEVTAAIEDDILEEHTGTKIANADTRSASGDWKNSLDELKKTFNTDDAGDEETESTLDVMAAQGVAAPAPEAVIYGDPRFGARPVKMQQQRTSGNPTSARKAKAAVIDSQPIACSEALSKEEEERAVRKLEALRRHRPSAPSSSAELVPAKKAEGSNSTRRLMELSEDLMSHFSADTEEVPIAASPPASSGADIDTLRKVIREEVERAQKKPAPPSVNSHPRATPATSEPSGWARFLVGKGVDPAIAEAIDRNALRRSGGAETQTIEGRTRHLNALKDEIAGLITTAGPLPLSATEPSVVSIIGPTGVGKTTTLSKLAYHYKHQQGKRVAIISLDTEKVGAAEQISGLASAVGAPMTVVADADALQQAILSYGDHDLILIDSAGTSQYRSDSILAAAQILEGIPDIRFCLTISATTKDLDVYGTIHHFSCFNIDSVIFTKLDETLAHGILVNVCQKMHQPIRYLTTGQRINCDITIADADSIARDILVMHNDKEHDPLRKLAAI